MMRLTPTAPMPSAWNRAVAVVRIRSRGRADTMAARLLLGGSGGESKFSLPGVRWGRKGQGRTKGSGEGEQELLGLLEGGGGAGLAEEGDGPLELDAALGRTGREEPAGRGQPGGGLVGAAADLDVEL